MPPAPNKTFAPSLAFKTTELFAVNVLLFAIVSVATVAGGVNTTLLILVAVAAPTVVIDVEPAAGAAPTLAAVRVTAPVCPLTLKTRFDAGLPAGPWGPVAPVAPTGPISP